MAESFHLIQLPNLPSAANHGTSQPPHIENTPREGPGMLSHHSLTCNYFIVGHGYPKEVPTMNAASEHLGLVDHEIVFFF